jgi:hypothetical protein
MMWSRYEQWGCERDEIVAACHVVLEHCAAVA